MKPNRRCKPQEISITGQEQDVDITLAEDA
jgi:hypothetical protein